MAGKIATWLLLAAGLAVGAADPAATPTDAAGLLQLAVSHLQGGKGAKPALGVYYLRKAAAAGSAEAEFNLGLCLENGFGVEKSAVLAFESYSSAAKAGVPGAKFRQAMLLRSGLPDEVRADFTRPGIEAQPERAALMLGELAREGMPQAMREVAAAELDKPADERDPEKLKAVVLLLTRAAGAGDAAAMRLLADCYFSGSGVARDPQRMLEYLNRAAELGDVEATGKLAYCYENGVGVAPDEKKAYELLAKAAARDLPLAQAKLGDFYWYGKFVPQDVPQAIRCYEKGATGGSAYGAFRLGGAYEEGIGVDKDPERAMALYMQAARANEPGALRRLGEIYRDGTLMPRDPGAAAYWFRRAAERGDVASMRELGLCLVGGKGVARDAVAGLALLKRAATAGDREARVLLESAAVSR